MDNSPLGVSYIVLNDLDTTPSFPVFPNFLKLHILKKKILVAQYHISFSYTT